MTDATSSPAHTPPAGAFGEYLGLEVTGWREGYARLELDLRPEYLNRSDMPHGGIITTLIDNSLSRCGNYREPPEVAPMVLTLSLTVNFIGQSRAQRLICEAHHQGGGRRIYFAEARVFNELGDGLAFGTGTMRIR